LKIKISVFIVFMFLFFTTVFPAMGIISELNHKSIPKMHSSDVEWSRTYGSSEFDMLHCIHQTQDGGYITSGVTEVSERYYPMLMKLDSNGNEEWNWTINQIFYEQTLYDILDVYPIFSDQVDDGGYLFCLWLDIDHEEGVPTIAGLFKFNENGELEWNKFYSEDFDWIFRPISFIENEDSFIVTGTSGDPYSYMGDDAGLLKTDKTGLKLWYKEYRYGEFDDRMEAVCKTNDGGYFLTGWGRDTSYNYWMIKTDASGNEQWNKTFGGLKDDYGHTKDCYQTSDGGFVTGGFSSSFGAGGFDVWIVKIDSIGDMVWNKAYGGKKNDVCWGIKSTDDAGYVFVSTMNYNGFSGDKDDINLVKIDRNGNIVWIQEFAGPDRQIGASVDKTDDGGFIVCGCTGMFHNTKSDGLVVKFAPFENQRPNRPDKPDGLPEGKPNKEYIFSTSASDPDGDALLYKWDWGDGNYSEWLETSEASHTWTTKDNYQIKVMAKDIHGGESDWSDSFPINIPKVMAANRFLLRFFENHPFVLLIFKKLITI
jgi:hypothetical protein